MPNGGSVNQIESSDFTTMSLGELSGLPSNLSHQHGDGAVVLGARDAARVVLAGDEAALAVAGVAVGVVGGLAEYADRAGLLLPAHDAVVGDVAPQQVAAVAEPGRPLAPAHARGEPLDAGEPQAILAEARIEELDGRVGIAVAWRHCAKAAGPLSRRQAWRRPWS